MQLHLLIIDLVASLGEIICDIVMFSLFIKNMNYFIRLKKARLESVLAKLSTHNKLVIAWVYLIVACNLYNSVSRIVMTPFVGHVIIGKSDSKEFFYGFEVFTLNLFIPISDLLTFLSFLALFGY